MSQNGTIDLTVEDLIEVQVPPNGINNDFPNFPDEWVRRWPAEEVWFARRLQAAKPMHCFRVPCERHWRPDHPEREIGRAHV